MPALTKPQLFKRIEQGDLLTVKNECVLYGKIVALHDWEIRYSALQWLLAAI